MSLRNGRVHPDSTDQHVTNKLSPTSNPRQDARFVRFVLYNAHSCRIIRSFIVFKLDR